MTTTFHFPRGNLQLYFQLSRRMINSDLKPENIIFLDSSDTFSVQVIDFGLAVRLGDDKEEHLDSNLKGTKQFLNSESCIALYISGDNVMGTLLNLCSFPSALFTKTGQLHMAIESTAMKYLRKELPCKFYVFF